MALNDIKKAILAQAKKEADEIIQEGEGKTAEIKAEWDKKVETKKKEIIASAKRKASQKIQQTQFKIQAQSQSEILGRKQKIIDQVYQTALKKLADLDDKDYVELMEKLIKQLPSGEGELTPVGDTTNLLKKALAKAGKKYNLSKDTIKGSGGFVFRSREIEIDDSFRALINNSKDQTILEVTRLLFEEKK